MPNKKTPEIKTLHSWVYEAMTAAMDWRAEAWRDCEIMDGGRAQWTNDDWENAKAANLEPITINRTFPVINLLLGSQSINKFNLVAKGRTQEDAEISQTMTEGIQFVLDQNNGEFIVSEAFKDQIVPGFGCLFNGFNSDPRKEKLKVSHFDWKEIWWDPFASPWFDPVSCRYVFFARWTDLDLLQNMFPEKKSDLDEKFNDMTGWMKDESSYFKSIAYDEATQVEEQIAMMGGGDWVDPKRKRVRPISLWFPAYENAVFAVFADGNVIEIRDSMHPMEQYQIITAAQEVVRANVQKMNYVTFLGDLILDEGPTPFHHDQYPFIPFVSYIDRFKSPYGVPRQIRGQNEEVNKRRTMALAMLKSRRITIEEDAVLNNDSAKLDALYKESQKIDSFLVLGSGGINKIDIKDEADLAQSQIALLEQSEKEIAEISGANEERRGVQSSKGLSGEAIKNLQAGGAVMSAPLFDNLRRSLHMLGDQVVSNIQGAWTHEKVLRITDRMTGAEKFVMLNQMVLGENGAIVKKNNVTQGKYDLVVSEMPKTDTTRELNLQLIAEWMKKATPEVQPHLMQLGLELSGLPNLDALMARLRPILGIDPTDEDLTAEEIKQKTIQELEAQQAEQQKQAEMQEEGIKLELENKALENEKLKAEIREIEANIRNEADEVKINRAKAVNEIQNPKGGKVVNLNDRR